MSSGHSLQKTLEAAGRKTLCHILADGSQVLLLPYGARVLGLFSPSSKQNFYWTNPALSKMASARELFHAKEWHNTGGDRTWLAPEIDVFFPDYPACQEHFEPPALDAAEYDLDVRENGVSMTRVMTLRFARAERKVRLRLDKTIGPAAHPLRYERPLQKLLRGIEYAGYAQRTRVRLLGASAKSPLPVGIWNLIQLPFGGEMLIPTYARTQPRVLFGDFPAGSLASDHDGLRFRMDFPGETKIAVRAAALTGRIGYLWKSQHEWSLVVRNFFIDPSGEYVDVPKDEPSDLGYAVHAVNVSSGLGDFCELEHHAPALGYNPRCVESTDVSQVWAFRGSKAAIAELAERLLGMRPAMGSGGGS